jgi:phosphohistidine phosphatase
MGRILMLMRHAQAAMPEPGMKDFDRPLTAHGFSEAISSARLLLATGHIPDLIIASPARRTLETVSAAKSILGTAIAVEHQMDLYSGDPRAYLAAFFGTSVRGVMLVGHNPMTEQVAIDLANSAGKAPRDLRVGFGTAAIAVFEIEAEDTMLKASKLLNHINP